MHKHDARRNRRNRYFTFEKQRFRLGLCDLCTKTEAGIAGSDIDFYNIKRLHRGTIPVVDCGNMSPHVFVRLTAELSFHAAV